MALKFLGASLLVLTIVCLSWHFAERYYEHARLRRWERMERTKRMAKDKARRVQEAVKVLYNEIEGNEEEQ